MSTDKSQTALFSQTSTQSSTEGLKTFPNMGLDSGDEDMDFDETILLQNNLQLVSTDNSWLGCSRVSEQGKGGRIRQNTEIKKEKIF